MELKNVTIKSIDELKTFDSGFSCVTFVVETDEEYKQVLQLQANKDKAENLIKYNKVGDKVDVSINLRGREWTNPQGEVKVFNTIEAWKVFKADKTVDEAAKVIDQAFEPAELKDKTDGDDLPF
jgi:plastocyanin domain-containing protein